MEIWKDIKEYERSYQVSNEGRVKSLDRVVITSRGSRHYKEKPLSQIKHGEYLHVFLGNKWFEVHQLVAEAFIPNPYDYTDVHHINHNPQDNRVENLIWISHEEHNTLHKSKRVDQIDKVTGEVLRQWDRVSDAARELGFTVAHISACARGERQSAYNFVWKYVLE